MHWNPASSLSFSGYIASDEQAQWWEQVRPQMEAEVAAGDGISHEWFPVLRPPGLQAPHDLLPKRLDGIDIH